MTRRVPRSSRARAARPFAVVSSPASSPETGRQSRAVAESGPVVGSLCTGYGGLDLGVLAALGAGRIAWVADPDPHVRQILDARMPGVPNLGDLRAIDWTHVEPVDVLVAGFPCQDISAAGKRVGIEKGKRSGLWSDIVAGVRVLRPTLLVVENVSALRWKGGGLHRVLGDLAEAGYDALWRSVRAADIGAAHRRERVFLLAWPRTLTDTHAADTSCPRRRSPGRRRPGQAPGAGAPSQLARRGERSRQAAANAGGLGCEELHSSHPDRWCLAARPGAAAADSARFGHRDGGTPGGRWVPAAAVPAGAAAGRQRDLPADTASDRRDEGLSRTTRLEGRPDAALRDHPAAAPQREERHLVAVADHQADTEGESLENTAHPVMDWGSYAPAVHRWEQLLGRPAPHPTQPGQHGRPVLAPAFVEHLMGLPQGWITDLPLPRTAQLRALGNGVVPAQAAYAVSLLLTDLAELLADERSGDEREAMAA